MWPCRRRYGLLPKPGIQKGLHVLVPDRPHLEKCDVQSLESNLRPLDYSEMPNVYSEMPQSLYNATREPYAPGRGRYSGSTSPALFVQSPYGIPEGPEHAYAGSHPPAHVDGASGASSATDSPPPLNPPSWPASGYGRTGAPPTMSQQTMDEGKLSVSIDFGQSSAPDSLPTR